MCSCEPGWTCPQCRGTALDDRYLPDERDDELARLRALAEAYGDDTGGER